MFDHNSLNLFFYDLLFAEAAIEQPHCVMHHIDIFHQTSVQNINTWQIQLFFSKNVDNQL